MNHNITVEGGTSVRLPTAGKYCDRDIVITAEGGGGGGNTLNEFIADTLEDADCDDVVSIDASFFRNKSGLKRVRLANLTKMGNYNFQDCDNLETIDLPKYAKAMGSYFGSGCGKLVNVNIPLVTETNSYAVGQCYALEKLDLPSLKAITGYSFRNCSKLVTLILRYPSGVDLKSTTNVFSNTPIVDGTGYIYVPKNLIDSYYKTATNWAGFADQFRAIEDYPEITGG